MQDRWFNFYSKFVFIDFATQELMPSSSRGVFLTVLFHMHIQIIMNSRKRPRVAQECVHMLEHVHTHISPDSQSYVLI